ncbi:MAG: hypothetical protein CMF50_01840 [Legionellales bacterium]|nr:hypothetical protein [Legionellales bacterium]
MNKPIATAGLRHVALKVLHFEECVDFYTRILGMDIEWQPDDDNVYLTSGIDNLALHRCDTPIKAKSPQRLDHIGFVINTPEQVDVWYDFLRDKQVNLLNVPKDHRDGARSFYFEDPDGNQIQLIYHAPLAKNAPQVSPLKKIGKPATKKKAPAKKTATAKKASTAKKPATKKTPAKKATSKKTTAKKTTTKKAATKKAATKKTTVKKAPAKKKPVAKKAKATTKAKSTRKTTAKKSTTKKTTKRKK